MLTVLIRARFEGAFEVFTQQAVDVVDQAHLSFWKPNCDDYRGFVLIEGDPCSLFGWSASHLNLASCKSSAIAAVGIRRAERNRERQRIRTGNPCSLNDIGGARSKALSQVIWSVQNLCTTFDLHSVSARHPFCIPLGTGRTIQPKG